MGAPLGRRLGIVRIEMGQDVVGFSEDGLAVLVPALARHRHLEVSLPRSHVGDHDLDADRVAVLVEAQTDNRNRTASDVRSIFTKNTR